MLKIGRDVNEKSVIAPTAKSNVRVPTVQRGHALRSHAVARPQHGQQHCNRELTRRNRRRPPQTFTYAYMPMCLSVSMLTIITHDHQHMPAYKHIKWIYMKGCLADQDGSTVSN